MGATADTSMHSLAPSPLLALMGTWLMFSAAVIAQPCSKTNLSPGKYALGLSSGGYNRTYTLKVPNTYDNLRPVKLVIAMHGVTQTAATVEEQSGFSTYADALPSNETFVVVYPQGLYNSWNAGVCCGEAYERKINDAQFILDLITDVRARSCIDRDYVFASGFSNGCKGPTNITYHEGAFTCQRHTNCINNQAIQQCTKSGG